MNVLGDLGVEGNFTGNQIFGSTTGNELGDIIISSSGVYYNITTVTKGLLNGFDFNESGNGEIGALVAGIYKLDSGWSFSGSANTEYHLRLAVNGLPADNCHAQRKIGTGADVGSATTAPCFVRLEVGDEVTAQIENVDNVNNAEVHDIGLTAVREGN